MIDTDFRDHKSRRPNHLTIIEGGGLKIIRAERDLFEWLFIQLDRTQPQISIDDHLRTQIDELREMVLKNGYVDWPPAYIEQLLCSIHWNQAPPDARSCGLQLLKFVSGLSQSMAMAGENIKVPCARIIEMMIWMAQGHVEGICYNKDQTGIRSTPTCEAKYGVRIRAKLATVVEYTDDIWVLHDLAGEMIERKKRKARRRRLREKRRCRSLRGKRSDVKPKIDSAW